MGSFNQEQQFQDRDNKQNDPLIFGGYLQIGNPEQNNKQEKLRKQKEYRDYLDMQSNQDKNRFENIQMQKPPIPGGPNQIGKQQNRPPSGIQRGQIPRQDNRNESFIQQGKSNWDEQFLQERRTLIGDQIFEQIVKKQAPSNQKIVLSNQNIQFSEQYLGQQNISKSQSRQQVKSSDFKEQNPFVQNTEEANKKKEIDRKKEYAMELQKQINEKKQIKDRQNSYEQQKPQKTQELKNISQQEQNQKDSSNYPQDAYNHSQQQQQLNYNQHENNYIYSHSQDYQNDFRWEQHMENDQLFQQILERKKQEFMKQYQEDSLLEQKYQNQNINYTQQPQYIDHGQKSSDIQQEHNQKLSQIQPNQLQEADLKRLKREEYKRELDEQVRLKEQNKTQKKDNQEKPIQKENEQIVQSKKVANEDINRYQNSDMERAGVRNRTDITKAGNQENKEALIKRLAYQEELKTQMEEKQRYKEAEKERQKREEEKIEREIQIQRQVLEQRENKELIKEGKILQDDKPKRQINRQQFETSDAIIGQQNSNVIKTEQIHPQFNQEENQFQDQSYIKQEYDIKQEFENRNLINQQDLQKDFAVNQSYQQEQLYQPLKLNQLSNYIPAPQQSDPQTVQIHQKLQEDQQKMIEMYQQALGQILDFRQNYIKESQDMQLLFMKERYQVVSDLHNNHQNVPHNFETVHQVDEIKKQENEISSLNAIQQQLNQLMNKINVNRQEKYSQLTSIINPQVQQNLNDLIKTQRDKIVRMSQTMSFREDIQGVNDKTILKNQQYQQFIPPQDQNNQNKIPFDQFDQSLASHSKLIKVPNQFTNKLKEKADNFQQQRLLNLSTNKVPQFTNTQENIPSDNNTSWFEHQQKSGNSPRRIVNANSKTNNMTNLYQTWQLAPESQASINQRISISPNKNQQQKIMQASLAGSSHLQYIHQNLEIQAQEYIQSPIHAQYNQLSPQSRQNFHGNNMNQRPLTNNNIYPNDTIEEVPEREQNMEDDNSTYLDENQVINLADQSQSINQNKNAYIQNNEENIKQTIPKHLPFQQNSNMKFRGFNQQESIETDLDINNRDDEMTQYSKSVYNRKSKVLSSKNQGFSQQNQLDANMQYIEQQVNQRQIHERANSYSRSPLQNDQNNNHFSPVAANQMVNIGQALANAQNYKQAIQINTQKSFYKPPLNVINQSNNMMANTSMAGAKPSITGSSFYNATMAKTKQQELNQEQELQKQLMKIFNSAEILSGNDDEDKKSNIKYQNQLEDESKNNDSNQRIGKTQFRRKKQVKESVQQQQFDDTQYLESASNINIAQSVAQSIDTNNNNLNFKQILQQPYQQNQVLKDTSSVQFNQNKQISKLPVNQFYTQKATFKNTSIIDQQQYSWLMLNNNNIISEQQELEQSKSKSKDEEIVTEYENTVGQTSQRPIQINEEQSQSLLESRMHFQRQNQSEIIQTNISEAIWDDPDILPRDDNHENEDKDYMESGTNKQSQIQEIYDQNSDAMHFDGTNGSNVPQFKIVSIKDENMQTGSLRSNFQNQNLKNNGFRISNQYNLNESYNTNIRQMNVQASQPYSINQAYNFEPKEDSEVPTSLNHQQNFEDEHSENRQMSSMQKNNNQKQDLNIKNDSAISGLNLCHGIYQESEPTSAAIIMNDKDFQKLKMYQPVLQTISDQESDPVKRALDNELIDQIYEIRNQNRQSSKNLEPFQQQKNMNMDQQQAERIQKNMFLLNQISSSQDNLQNQKMMHPQRQYNPKQYDINTIKEEGELSSNLQTREIDPIINSTPSLVKIDSQMSNENNQQIQNEFKIVVKKTGIQNPIEIQQIFSADLDQSLQNVEFQKNSQFIQQNNAFQQSLTNEQQYKNDEDFQEIIKDKINKINNIFNFEKIDNNMNLNENQNKNQSKDSERQVQTPGKKEKIEIEKCSSPRLMKNNISDAKNQELEDLARLIQQATGSVNNIVESSQQLMQSRQYDRIAAAKLRAKQKANGSSVNTTLQSQIIIEKKQEDHILNPNLFQEDQKNQFGFQDKIENSQSDIKILSNLDQLIQNLEKQQEENFQFQNKFSSNKAYISQLQSDKYQEQNHGSALNQKEIMKQYIEEEDLNNFQIKEILERNIQNSLEEQNPNSYEKDRMQTAENKIYIQKNRNINDSECNTEIKETIMVDEKYQIKLQKQYIRPISGRSALSISTNRYATSCQTPHINVNSNIKKKDQQVEYQEFNDDDDNAKNNYGHEQDSN